MLQNDVMVQEVAEKKRKVEEYQKHCEELRDKLKSVVAEKEQLERMLQQQHEHCEQLEEANSLQQQNIDIMTQEIECIKNGMREV